MIGRPPGQPPFALDLSAPPLVRAAVNDALGRLLGLDRLNRVYAAIPPASPPAEFVRAGLRELGVTYTVAAADLAAVPATGPLVVVANHPFGAVEGLVLLDLLFRVRPDVSILANRLLTRIPELRGVIVDVDVFGADAARTNGAPLRRAVRDVKSGRCLAAFPAGEVSHVRLGEGVTDPPWNPSVAAIARLSGASVLPVYFAGANGPLFQAAGLVHPRLRTALLPRELLNKSAAGIEVRVGAVVRHDRVAEERDATRLTALLRERTYVLARRSTATTEPIAPTPTPSIAADPVAEPENPAALAAQIASLPAASLVAESGSMCVHLVSAKQAPLVLREIGRLREETFRAVGEGTGRERDLDRFDEYYEHLVLWDRAASAVAGSYRLAASDVVLRERGTEGLYTTTLFDLRESFFTRMGPAIELGRSFVAARYQRSFSALMLLWKGIGAYVVRHPHLRTLFGPVSISRAYSPFARQLMVEWLRLRTPVEVLDELAAPRNPLRTAPRVAHEARRAAGAFAEIDDLSDAVAQIEPTLRGVPILLREYHRLGGRYAAFNVDPAFNDVVDGLVVIDLTRTEPRVLDRYLGKPGGAAFRAYQSSRSPGGAGF